VQTAQHRPILVDSIARHRQRHKVLPLSLAAVAVGADAPLVKYIMKPEKGLFRTGTISYRGLAKISWKSAKIAEIGTAMSLIARLIVRERYFEAQGKQECLCMEKIATP